MRANGSPRLFPPVVDIPDDSKCAHFVHEIEPPFSDCSRSGHTKDPLVTSRLPRPHIGSAAAQHMSVWMDVRLVVIRLAVSILAPAACHHTKQPKAIRSK